jgi:hypothetical protein
MAREVGCPQAGIAHMEGGHPKYAGPELQLCILRAVMRARDATDEDDSDQS